MEGLPECGWFYAVCNHMPGECPSLRVGGTVKAPTRGWTAELVEYQGPPSPNQFLLQLTLKLTAPSGPVAEAITPIEVELEIREPHFEYNRVEFHIDGPEGIEPPEPVEVDHPALAPRAGQASAAGQISR